MNSLTSCRFSLVFLLLLCAGAFHPLIAQQAEADSTDQKSWTRSWVIGLQANQYNYKDWSYGGNNAFAFTARTLFELNFDGLTYTNIFRVRMRFGQSRLKEGELEKIEDLIRLSNRTEYKLKGETFSAFLELAFRTQFAEGFDPVTNERTSAFLSPGYYIENIGLSYKPADYFSTYLGVGLKQTVVESDGLDRFYGLGEDEDVRGEGGITFSYEFDKEILSGIRLESEFNAFSNLLLPIKSTD
ncbi:MAG TPA: hypothetical protein DEG32_00240, partial [Balneolaceae bacterium]|nr:hypothetical protein [Balneolaceae bacterium]